MTNNELPVIEKSGVRFQMPVRTQLQVVFFRWKDWVLFLIMLAAAPVGFALLYSPASLGGPWGPGTTFGCVLGVLGDIGMLYAMGPVTAWLSRHTWLDPIHCDELAALCREHPDLGHFRDQVVGMGRRFTHGEFSAMKRWPGEKVAIQAHRRRNVAVRTDCQQLYTHSES